MEFPQLGHLKVADLKQHLKQRGLSIVGNKSDLVQRLGNAMLEESSTTTNKLNQNITVGTVNNIIKNPIQIDEEAILGDDDDDETPSMKPIDDSLIQNEDLLLNETNNEASTIAIKPATLKNTNTVNQSLNNAGGDSLPSASKTTTSAESAKATRSVSASKQSAITAKTGTMTTEERKQLRMIKFADPKLINRAERFGMVVKTPEPSEDGKLLQRVQRFGEVVSNKAKSLDERERLERRKDRFGSVARSNDNSIKSASSNLIKKFEATNQSPLPESIKKRQERFGLIDKPVALATPMSGNKRRRYAV